MGKSGSGWSSVVKAILVAAGVLGVLTLIAVIVGVSWWRRHGEEFVAGSQSAIREGREAGQNSSEDMCMMDTVESTRGDASFSAMVQNSVRLRSCLGVARISERFCTNVPRAIELVATTNWRVKRCEELKLSSVPCGSVLQTVQQYCVSPERQAKLDEEKKQ